MAVTETDLKERLRAGNCPLYVLYGPESYLTEQYARRIAATTVEEGLDAFNLHKFDGQTVDVTQLEEAVEALPLMAEKTCVLVRDMDAAGPEHERLMAMLEHLPDTCVLVFWQMTVQPDSRKGWKVFLDKAGTVGMVVKFEHKTVPEAARLLVAGAQRRGCRLEMEDARYLVEQVGNDLNLLLREMDKLCALAADGSITRQQIDTAATKNLETRVFDLTKAILGRNAPRAYVLLRQLAVQREEPLVVLGVLSNAYADLYRAKVALGAGVPPESLAADFKTTYKNKEFRLRNAGRDVARLSLALLRDSLEVLAQTDNAMKFGGGDQWELLEQTVARLIRRVEEG